MPRGSRRQVYAACEEKEIGKPVLYIVAGCQPRSEPSLLLSEKIQRRRQREEVREYELHEWQTP